MNKRRGERGRVREEFWRAVVRRRESAGMTVREFCRRERLHESTYHFWRRELKRRDAESAAAERSRHVQFGRANRRRSAGVSLVRPGPRKRIRAWSASPSTAQFVPVTVAAVGGAGPVAEIVLPGSRVVRVARGCDGETLGMVLAVLSSVPSGASGEERPC